MEIDSIGYLLEERIEINMEFSYDFSSGKAYVVCQTGEGTQLDKKAYLVIKIHNDIFLPMEMRTEKSGYRFLYNIDGKTNMKAWFGEAGFREKEKMREQIQTAIQKVRNNFEMIAEEQLITEEKYMFVDDVSGKVSFICVPILIKAKAVEKSANRPEIPPATRETVSKQEGKNGIKSLEQPLPDVTPVPKSDMVFDEFVFNKVKQPKEKEEYNFSIFETWEKKGAQNYMQENPKEQTPPLYEAIKPETEEKPRNLEEDYGSTMLLKKTDDDEKTILLNEWNPAPAKLIRVRTGEIYTIQKRESRIGKKESSTDICIKNNPTVSRNHCIIRYSGSDYYIEDCNSTNYTYVEGKQLLPGKQIKLTDNCKLQMSDEEFVFCLDNYRR